MPVDAINRTMTFLCGTGKSLLDDIHCVCRSAETINLCWNSFTNIPPFHDSPAKIMSGFAFLIRIINPRRWTSYSQHGDYLLIWAAGVFSLTIIIVCWFTVWFLVTVFHLTGHFLPKYINNHSRLGRSFIHWWRHCGRGSVPQTGWTPLVKSDTASGKSLARDQHAFLSNVISLRSLFFVSLL